MQNLIVMHTFSALDQKYRFWANLVQINKIVILSCNFVLTLIWICRTDAITDALIYQSQFGGIYCNFIYSCQLYCYFLIHEGGRGDFVTFSSRKSRNHSLNSVWIAYATTTETYNRKSDTKLVGFKRIITSKNYWENPMLLWWWLVIQS